MNELARRWFWVGCGFETALGLAALPLGYGLGVDWAALTRWNPARDAVVGLAVCLPLLALPWAVWHAPGRVFRDVRAVVEALLRPVLGRWSAGQMLTIALLAGVAEEALFRGALQGGLTGLLGPAAALGVASVLFGLCHALNRAYALLATGMGLVLGLEFQFTGTLWAPALTHAAYDFFALLYLLRWTRPAA